MGSPWPLTQHLVKATGNPVADIQNNNNHHKRGSNGHESYMLYNNHHNFGFHHSQLPATHQTTYGHHQRPLFTSPGTHEQIHDTRKRSLPFLTYDGGTHTTNNNSVSSRILQPSYRGPFSICVKEIPTWNIYFSDQRDRLVDFTDKTSSIRPDSSINQLVSLCFVDTCITNLSVDAIVNSTTQDYSGVDGVDRQIHGHAGRNLREACKSLPRLEPGQTEMTLGFSLPAKYVIHTNGPLTEDAEKLTGCYVNAFNLLLLHGLRTIAFPCIATGKKGLPKKFAAEVALKAVRYFLQEHRHQVDRVIFCLHHQKDIEIYLRYMQIYFPVADPELRIANYGHS